VFDMSGLFTGVVSVVDTPMSYIKMVLYKDNTTDIVVLNKSGQLNYFLPNENTLMPIADIQDSKLASGEIHGGSSDVVSNYTTFIESWSKNTKIYDDIIMS